MLQAEGQQTGSGVSLSVCLPAQMGQLVERWPTVHNALTLWDSRMYGLNALSTNKEGDTRISLVMSESKYR